MVLEPAELTPLTALELERIALEAGLPEGALDVVATPFGGFKQSGVGRELGPHALEHYTEVKNGYYATEAT